MQLQPYQVTDQLLPKYDLRLEWRLRVGILKMVGCVSRLRDFVKTRDLRVFVQYRQRHYLRRRREYQVLCYLGQGNVFCSQNHSRVTYPLHQACDPCLPCLIQNQLTTGDKSNFLHLRSTCGEKTAPSRLPPRLHSPTRLRSTTATSTTIRMAPSRLA